MQYMNFYICLYVDSMSLTSCVDSFITIIVIIPLFPFSHCMYRFYNARGVGGTACLPCPEGAVCNGGTSFPIPQAGYNRKNDSHPHAYKHTHICAL